MKDSDTTFYYLITNKEALLNKALEFLITGGVYLALFTPLILSGKFFFPFVGPKSLYFLGLAEIIFLAYLFLAISSARYRPKFNFVTGALALFTLILIISSLLGADPSYSFWSKYERVTGLLMWLHLLAFFIVTSSVFKKRDWHRVFAVSILVAVLVGLAGLAARAGWDIFSSLSRAGSTLGNSSFLATYLLFNAFLAFYLFSQKKFKIYSVIAFSIISLALFLSTGRAALVSFFGGAFLLSLLWLAFTRQGKQKLVGVILLTVFVLGSLGILFLFTQSGSFVQQEFIERAGRDRLIVWGMAWQGLMERPLLGWGPENFDLVFNKHFEPCLFLPECGGEIWFDRAHNTVFDTLVASGIIGLLSYLSIFLAVFYALWRKYFKNKLDFWSAGVFSVLLIAYFIQNFTVFDMVSSYMMLFLVLGFISYLVTSSRQEETVFKFPRPLLSIGLLILFLFSFNRFVIQPALVDNYIIQVFGSSSSSQRVALSEKLFDLSPLGRYQSRELLSNNTVKNINNRANNGMSDEDIRKELVFMAGELEKSTQESPLNYRCWLKLGEFYNFYSKFDASKTIEAERALDQAIKLSPNNQQGYWALAQTRSYQGDLQASYALAEKALELNGKVVHGHKVIIQIAQMMGDDDLVKERAQIAIPFAEEMIEARPLVPSYFDFIQIAQTAGELDLAREKAKEGISVAEKAVQLKPEVQSYLNLIQMAQVAGDQDLVRRTAEEAVGVDPRWQPHFEKFLGE